MINYVIGDATDPQGDGEKIIAHICNNEGAWGAGFVVALSRQDKIPEKHYRWWHETGHEPVMDVPFELGRTQFVAYKRDDVWVANMIAQRGIRRGLAAPPVVDYDALEACLKQVAAWALSSNASVHMPRIGCGLGGGTWDKVEPIIKDTLCSRGVPVTVYDLA